VSLIAFVAFIGSADEDDTELVIVIHELQTFLGSNSVDTISRLRNANIKYSMLGEQLMLDMDHQLRAGRE
jgi:hypothetical protein